MACALTTAAAAQTSSIAPYLQPPPHHSPEHHHVVHHDTDHHTEHRLLERKAVPVVRPHHGVAVRRPPRGTEKGSAKSALKTVAKVVAPAVKPVPKKPERPRLPADVGPNSGLKLPRYAALKSDDVNMRAGPGERYPVLWTYHRRDLPVKIEREFDIWRQVEDMDGIKGWMQEGFVTSGHRSFVITGSDDRTLRADASDTADAVAILKPGVVGRIKECDAGKDWCRVQVQGYSGWLKRSDFWGADPGEVITP